MLQPNFSIEKSLWKRGYKYVAGADEVGRGAFAGPVVAACVVFPQNTKYQSQNTVVKIDDSKKLSPGQRGLADVWIRRNVLVWGVGETSVSVINRQGMARATKTAFRKAIKSAKAKLAKKKAKLDYLLIDAFFIPYVPGLPTKRRKNKKGRYLKNARGKQLAVVNGDEKIFSVAAASIIAKVYRDKLMLRLAMKYPVYGWEKNKGYGTKEHQNSILKYGVTKYHRKQFVNTLLA